MPRRKVVPIATRDRVCGNCGAFKDTTEPGSTERAGECRRRSPAVLHDPEEGAFCMWPFVDAGDWYLDHVASH